MAQICNVDITTGILLIFIDLIVSVIISHIEQGPILDGNITKRTKLFFGIVTTEGSWFKRQMMFEIWINKTIQLGHDYVYCTKDKIEPKYRWTPLKNWTDVPFSPDADRKRKRLTMAEYFLKNTTADFFINPTDDVFVDSSRINKLAYILGTQYNTNENDVVLGNCVLNCDKRKSSLQGGTGYIMTRKMAKKFVDFAAKWLQKTKVWDDYEFNDFLSSINQSPKTVACPYMAGLGFNGLDRKFDFSSLTVCPEFHHKKCGTGILKFDEIYIVHANLKRVYPSLRTWNNFLRMLNDKDHHYAWYDSYRCSAILCRLD
ncbi:hypothetical protein M9Y10_023813 [Tritrichomonas musculus]|uniref:Nucleotide-diphospho-sugar transferase domain-containing protein n=1 Tax=Tritrichomonas musculus TaxID=1915356 RepID=A0ABR2KY14_9EUKA